MKNLQAILFGCASSLVFTSNLYAAEDNAIVVSANRFAMQENETPYAAEIYTLADIQNSGADSLYDFLDQHTSLTVLPSYGNPHAQKLDMRGYGIGDGYQNMVVTLNGQRLNNIDMVPQLLSAISLQSIERIEISKGSGSVISGDGAMAGVLHIITKDKSKVSFGATTGSHGQYSANVSAGVHSSSYSISVSGETTHLDGYSEADVTGNKDESDSKNYALNGKYFPTEKLELRLALSESKIDTIYPGALTQDEFKSNPAQNSDNTYTVQSFDDSNTSAGITYDFSDNLSLVYDIHQQEKTSEFVTSSYLSNYEYDSHDLAVKYNTDSIKLIAGIQQFDGDKIQTSSTTSKLNTAYFAQAIVKINTSNITIGARSEEVEYTYAPSSGSTLNDTHSLSAYDIGANHKFSSETSLFANYQHAYQAPDVDRFFHWSGTFNEFIEPAISDTLNIGVYQKIEGGKLKLTAFTVNLEDEIYYNASTFSNTNIDRSHKYGLEVDFSRNVGRFNTRATYAYTKAVIDSEDDGNGSFDGKNLPGVSEHNLNLGLSYKFSDQLSGSLNHVYRSEAYSANDFANELTQKQPAYNSTNLYARYKLSNTSIFAGMDNLFDKANGIQIRDDAIYPVNHTRTWKIGFKTEL